MKKKRFSSEGTGGTLPIVAFPPDYRCLEETKRLSWPEALMPVSQGDLVPELQGPRPFQRVLDVGCGTGDWLIALANASPTSELLIGVDTSRTFLTVARARARAEQIDDRVEFHVMDALRMLEFPTGFFDLVTHRGGMSWLRTWEWRKLLQEYQRVVRQDGLVRCVEADLPTGTGPAFTALRTLMRNAFVQAGHLFGPERDGLMGDLPGLFHQHGLRQIQTHLLPLAFPVGTPEGLRFADQMRLAFRSIEPFLRHWLRVPDTYQDLCRQAADEMRQPGFVATSSQFTIWGRAGWRDS